jgi:hypothetical protein
MTAKPKHSLSLTACMGLMLLGAAYLMPGHYSPWPAFQAQWAAAIATLLFAFGAAVGRAKRSTEGLRIPPLALTALLLAFVPPLQLAFGLLPFAADALLSSLYLMGLAFAIVAAAAVVPEGQTETLHWLFAALLAAALVSVALALVQWLQIGSFLFIADLRPGNRPGANLAQPNHLATLLCLGVVGLLYFYETRRVGGAAATVVLLWLGLGLVMTQSRTGWLSIGLLALWSLWRRRPFALRLHPLAVVVASALFIGFIAAWPVVNELLLLSPKPLEERIKPGTRWLHWRALWEALWLQPWFGYGWQQVSSAQLRTALDFPPTQEMIQNSHSVLLDLLIWNGVLVGGVVAACMLWWFIVRVRYCADIASFVLIAAIGVIGTHALLEYPLDHTYFLLPFGLFIGLLDVPTAPRLYLARRLFAAMLAGILVMVFWIGAEYLQVEQANRDVRMMLARIGLDKVSKVPPPNVRLLDGSREYHRFMITPARPDMTPVELDWMRAVMQRNAYPPTMLRYALAAGLNGRADDAAQTLRRICHIHPDPRCEEARDAWRSAQELFPALASIPVP